MFTTAIIIFLIIFGVYQKVTNRYYNSNKRLDNKTMIITGGTAGIGLEIARDISKRGARVIVACPFEDEGRNAIKMLIADTGNRNVDFKYLDLGSLKSIREFANDILANEARLDVLINNAGVGVPVDRLTEDGINFILQVNYYGTFLLTILLLPLLKKSSQFGTTRILTTASFLHWFGRMDVNNLKETKYWCKLQMYCDSKMYLVFFAKELTKKLKGTNVVINNVDPGLVATKIYDSVHVFFGAVMRIILTVFFRTPMQGAQTAIYAALDEKSARVSGVYFRNCYESILVRSADDETLKDLWEASVRMVKLSDEELLSSLN